MPNHKEVTVVCCTNDMEKLRSELKRSLSSQSMEYDLIVINNKNNRFRSCSAAYNSVINKINTKYVIYSHQDITLLEEDTLEKFLGYLKKISFGDIVGVAGTKFDKRDVISSIYHGKDRHRVVERPLRGIKKCDTLDECFFGGLTETFRKYPFNENLCDNWHLYCVERCLHNKVKGHNVYVCECSLLHSSTGIVSPAFYDNFRRICKAYHKSYPEIYTTCARSKTDIVSRTVYCLFHDLKLLIKSVF